MEVADLDILLKRRRWHLERCLAGEDLEEGGPEAVDVGPRPEQAPIPLPLLRGGIGGGSAQSPRQNSRRGWLFPRGGRRRVAARRSAREIPTLLVNFLEHVGVGDLREPPVDDLGLAEVAGDDVLRLDVEVEDAAGVGKLDRPAGSGEVPKERPEGQLIERVGVSEMVGGNLLVERTRPEIPHHLEELATGMLANVVTRHDPRMLEVRTGASLAEKSPPVPRVFGELRQNLLEKDFPIELAITGDPHLPHPSRELPLEELVAASAGGVAPERHRLGEGVGISFLPRHDRRLRPHRRTGRRGGVGPVSQQRRGDPALVEDAREACLRVPRMQREVALHDLLDEGPIPVVDRPLGDEDVGQLPRRVAASRLTGQIERAVGDIPQTARE